MQNCRYLLLVLLVVFSSGSALAQPVVWNNPNTGAAAGNWSSAANWSPATVPTSSNNAQISNGGEARITSDVLASRIEVGKNGSVGTLTSSAAGIQIIIDSDFDIGEIGGDFATGSANVTSNGTATLTGASYLLVGDSGEGDLDVGQANATLSATANSHGVLTLSSIALVEVLNDADIGQAGGTANATANGELRLLNVADFQVGADLDIGQSGGTGRAHANGFAELRNSQVTVGASVDVGRTTGSAGGNTGNGTLEVVGSTLSIGFADPLLPGSLNIGDGGAGLNEIANSLGAVSLRQSTLEVANRVNVGGLSGGGTNALNSGNGSLSLIESSATADHVSVAVVIAPTAGQSAGTLGLDSSLLTIANALELGSNATLEFTLGGSTRADGTNVSGQYGAIDAASAILGGELVVSLGVGFAPTAGDQFDLIATTGFISSSFASSDLPQLDNGLSWQLSQTSSLLQLQVVAGGFDGDFDADGDVDAKDFLSWQRGLGTQTGAAKAQGDADLDGDVDQHDLAFWQASYGTGSASPIIASTQNIPEPHTATLLLALFATAMSSLRIR